MPLIDVSTEVRLDSTTSSQGPEPQIHHIDW
jgi:hypothetical protein